MSRPALRAAALWILFFLISCGLGYATVSRYDPRTTPGTFDASRYARLAEGATPDPTDKAMFRVVVPYVAMPFARLARGHVGHWNATLLGLLVANAGFCAMTASLLLFFATKITGDGRHALTASLLYLASFNVINHQLAGLVDSAETCAMMLLTIALRARRWWWLPVIGVFGALSKETFLPLGVVFSIAWLSAEEPAFRRRQTPWVSVMALGAAGFAAIYIVRSIPAGAPVSLWSLIASERGGDAAIGRFLAPFADRQFWCVTLGCVPGLFGLRFLPVPWIRAALVASLATLALSAWHDSGGGAAGRGVFDVLMPLATLGLARVITKM